MGLLRLPSTTEVLTEASSTLGPKSSPDPTVRDNTNLSLSSLSTLSTRSRIPTDPTLTVAMTLTSPSAAASITTSQDAAASITTSLDAAASTITDPSAALSMSTDPAAVSMHTDPREAASMITNPSREALTKVVSIDTTLIRMLLPAAVPAAGNPARSLAAAPAALKRACLLSPHLERASTDLTAVLTPVRLSTSLTLSATPQGNLTLFTATAKRSLSTNLIDLTPAFTSLFTSLMLVSTSLTAAMVRLTTSLTATLRSPMTLTVSRPANLMSEALTASHCTLLKASAAVSAMSMLLVSLSTATVILTVSAMDTVTATSEELIFQALILNLVRTIRSRTSISTAETRESSAEERFTKALATKSALLVAGKLMDTARQISINLEALALLSKVLFTSLTNLVTARSTLLSIRSVPLVTARSTLFPIRSTHLLTESLSLIKISILTSPLLKVVTVVKVPMVLSSALGVLEEDLFTLATAREIMVSTARVMVQAMASVVSKALLAAASESKSSVSETMFMARAITSPTRATTSPTRSPTTCLTSLSLRISTTDPSMTSSSQLLMALTTSTTVIRAALTTSTLDLSALVKLVVPALASRMVMALTLISNTLLVLSTMMMRLASVILALTGLSLTSTPITVSLTPISTKPVSMTTSRLPRARFPRRKGSMNSFLAATSAMTHLSSTTSPTADLTPSLSSTAGVPSVMLTGTHSITLVVETATEAMAASAVVVPTTVAALRATPRHHLEALVDSTDSEKLIASRQEIQT